MKKIFLSNMFLLFIFTSIVLAADPDLPAPFNLVLVLVGILTPIAVWAATEFFKKVSTQINGKIIVAIVVPIISLIVVSITQQLDAGIINPWLQGALGLLAVFFSQLLIQFKKASQ